MVSEFSLGRHRPAALVSGKVDIVIRFGEIGPNVKLRCRYVCPLAGNVAAALPGRRPELQCR